MTLNFSHSGSSFVMLLLYQTNEFYLQARCNVQSLHSVFNSHWRFWYIANHSQPLKTHVPISSKRFNPRHFEDNFRRLKYFPFCQKRMCNVILTWLESSNFLWNSVSRQIIIISLQIEWDLIYHVILDIIEYIRL